MISFDKKRSFWLACLLLAVGTLALYWPVRHYDFVQYDDNDYVFNNPEVRAGLSWWGLVWSFVDAHASNWHPLTWLSHMLDCQLFGLNAGAHHLVNAFLHSINAVLLFLLLRSMTGAFGRSLFVAALFAVHPLRVESVAWISERKDVLSGLFFMLTVWAYVRFTRHQSQWPNVKSSVILSRSAWYRLTLLFFALGLLAKPMLITVPFILLLVDLWPLNRLERLNTGESSPGKTAFSGIGGLLKEKVPFFILSAAISLITFFAQGTAVVSVHSMSIFSRIVSSLVNYVCYVEKLFWPRNLTVLYLRPQSVPAETVILAVVVLLAVSGVAAANFRRRPYLTTGWLWFLGMLLPVSGLMQTGLQSIADRYTYLPSIGLSLMLVWGICDWAGTLRSTRLRQTLLAASATLVVCVFAALTRHQLACWRNTETLMGHVLEIDPNNYIAHNDLGVYLSKHGRTQEAQFHYQRMRELDPALKGSSNDTTTNVRTNDAQSAKESLPITH